MNDFILIIDNAITDEFCDVLREHIDDKLDNSATVPKVVADDMGRKDEQMFLCHTNTALHSQVNEVLNNLCELYRDKYPTLKNCKLSSIDNKLQRTHIGGGYHAWHFEQTNSSTSRRVITWSIYLNDVTEGGETEFLYQNKRIKAKKGTAVFFPACYTHTHRGNPPISNNKYIVTGWYNVL